MTLEERFQAKVIVGTAPDHRPELGPCLLWTGALNADGYGRFVVDGKEELAHRVAAALAGVDIEGELFDHLCRVRNCVEVLHLDPVTNVENVMRGESPAARNARKSECLRGHPFDAANTRVTPKGERQCRACNRDRAREKRAA